MAAIKSDVPAIGIDLGTTYSCVGVFRSGQVEIIENDHGNRTTPSCVAFDENQRFIGEAAKNMIAVNLNNSVYGTKRLIGRRFNDPIVQSDLQNFPFKVIDDRSNKPIIQVNYKKSTQTFLPEEISAMLLFKMKETAEAHLGMTVSKAVISVPAYFNDSQRRATMDAGVIAGFKYLRIMNEPTAAALAYGYRLKNGKTRTILIFDLGGGTCDVSVVTIRDGEFRVLATTGDTHLGGDDFNSRLVKHFTNEFKEKYEKDVSNDKRAISSLQMACERAKLCLSSTTQASFTIDSFYEGINFSSSISRARFEELNADLFRATIDLVEKAIRDADLAKTDIEEVVLVGGSTRIPKIRMLLQDFFNGKELSKTINPDEAVAYGATILAAMLNGDPSCDTRNLVVQDVTTFKIGYFMGPHQTHRERVISRNVVIPTKVTKRFKTSQEFPTDRMISVYERDHQEPYTLGHFELHGVPPSPRGLTEVDITFNISHDGILNVTAVENSSGTWNSLAVSLKYWKTIAELVRMIADAERFRLDDFEQRKRDAARNDLELYCYSAKSGIVRVNHISKEAIVDMIEQTIQWLENCSLASVEEMELKKKNIEHMLNRPTIPHKPHNKLNIPLVLEDYEISANNVALPIIVTQENRVIFFQESPASQMVSPVEKCSLPGDRECLETSQ